MTGLIYYDKMKSERAGKYVNVTQNKDKSQVRAFHFLSFSITVPNMVSSLLSLLSAHYEITLFAVVMLH